MISARVLNSRPQTDCFNHENRSSQATTGVISLASERLFGDTGHDVFVFELGGARPCS